MSSFVDHVIELLEPLGPVRAQAMMGGHIVRCGALSVGLVSDERLYLKVDGETRDAFASAGGEPFAYARRGKRIEMSYWAPPDGALDSSEEMLPWARLALQAATRSTATKPRGRSAARRAPRRGRSRR